MSHFNPLSCTTNNSKFCHIGNFQPSALVQATQPHFESFPLSAVWLFLIKIKRIPLDLLPLAQRLLRPALIHVAIMHS